LPRGRPGLTRRRREKELPRARATALRVKIARISPVIAVTITIV